MPFDRLAHVTPAAHNAFEHAFERTLDLATEWFEASYELHLDATSDPEYADTQEFRDHSDLVHWRYRYLDEFCRAYRSQLGRARPLRYTPAAWRAPAPA
jgi:hypothetical protein